MSWKEHLKIQQRNKFFEHFSFLRDRLNCSLDLLFGALRMGVSIANPMYNQSYNTLRDMWYFAVHIFDEIFAVQVVVTSKLPPRFTRLCTQLLHEVHTTKVKGFLQDVGVVCPTFYLACV